MSRNWLFYLEDILESVGKIQRYTRDVTFESFCTHDMLIDAVVRNLEIIGEAAKHLPPEARSLMSEVDWSKAAGFRDVIAHGYFGLDLYVVWDVVQTKVPVIAHSTEKVLQQLRNEPG
jgi:uncharacterized protein with HEPN domain